MALINCIECKKEISDKAVSCPHCGCPINNSGVVIKGVDPFAQYHTPIQGKKSGQLTVLGKIGVWIITPLLILAAVISIKEGYPMEGLYCGSFALTIGVGGFLWARK
jgi:hypothetical protein